MINLPSRLCVFLVANSNANGEPGAGNRNQEVERNNDTGTGRLKLEIETRNHFIEFVSFICFITLTFLTASINNMTPNLMNGQCSIKKFDIYYVNIKRFTKT